MKREINRLKVVLAEKKRTNRWLADQLGKNEATISKWCTNKSQPSLDDFSRHRKVFGSRYKKFTPFVN